MADIFHRVQMHASPAEVFRALTEQAGLSRWWARDGKLVVKMRIAEMKDDARVAWQCVEGPPDWIGTDISFDLAEEGDETVVRFGHRNWREATDFMGHCSAKWAYFLFSLKSVLETPEPDDVLI